MKIALNKGLCALRWNCKNVNKKCCNPEPKGNDKTIECNNFRDKN